jgi:hypothetical protein
VDAAQALLNLASNEPMRSTPKNVKVTGEFKTEVPTSVTAPIHSHTKDMGVIEDLTSQVKIATVFQFVDPDEVVVEYNSVIDDSVVAKQKVSLKPTGN